METSYTWHELLGKIINNSQEHQRLARTLHISPTLLVDWTLKLATPQPHQLYQMIMALPEHQPQLLPLMARELERIYSPTTLPKSNVSIPPSFYAQVLNSGIIPPQPLRFWTLSHLILQQALQHLDPVRLGLSMQLVRCMPPGRQGKIRSLRVVYSLGTEPWQSHLTTQTLLLGAESLAGYAVSGRCSAVVHSQAAASLYPKALYDYTESLVAYPIMSAEMVAGCLLIASTQPAYFDSMQLSLIQEYTDLLTLAFNAEDFYPPWTLELHLLPAPFLQQQRLRLFGQRLEALVHGQQQEGYDIEQLKLQVWQQFEEDFLQTNPNGLLAS